MLATADPVVLLSEIRAAQEDLGRRVDQRGVAEARGSAGEIINVAAPVTTTQGGEQRAIHRRPYRRLKPVPRRPRMLDAYEDQTRRWLQRQPGMTWRSSSGCENLRRQERSRTRTRERFNVHSQHGVQMRFDSGLINYAGRRKQVHLPRQRQRRSKGGQALRAWHQISKKLIGTNGRGQRFALTTA